MFRKTILGLAAGAALVTAALAPTAASAHYYGYGYKSYGYYGGYNSYYKPYYGYRYYKPYYRSYNYYY
ncbi:sulfur globule protein precursor [Pseudorhodoplanes sp.]|uniref:sulfur globule protein precursor n=1 Tax=Pseudorhodoplanes sp. TaxID=1934341 RepID=UPI002C6BF93F|nr:sulfur globule protein precursor [Pseudorhodoplanes sp.]HWV53511.1 sulfur globule protein precursor [Pseudorhodoplanes sp.]